MGSTPKVHRRRGQSLPIFTPARRLQRETWGLDTYYDREFTQRVLSTFVAIGSSEQIRKRLQEYMAAGVNSITLRLTSYDQMHQFRRVSEEVLPGLATEEG